MPKTIPASLFVSVLIALAGGCQSNGEPPSASSQRHAPHRAAQGGPHARAASTVSFGSGSLSLERIYAEPPLAGRSVNQPAFSPDGKTLAWLQPNEEDSEQLDVWALDLSAKGARPFALVKTRDLLGGQQEILSEAERMAKERKRIRHSGITSYKWCGEESPALLFPLSGDLYLARVTMGETATPAVDVVRLTEDAAPKLDPRCSPAGRFVSFVQDHDVHIIELESKARRALTSGGTDVHPHGLAEFVAQEEMGRYEGHFWSKDEKFLAYLDVDLSPVGTKVRPRIFADRTEMFSQRYPAAGEANAIVRVHVVEIDSGRDSLLETPTPDGYIARVGFTGDHDVFVQWQSRDQKTLSLLYAEGATGPTKKILDEEDDAWVELHDDLKFLPDGRFVWPSERDGWRRLYLMAPDGAALRPITPENVVTTELVSVDKKTGDVYFMAATKNGIERQLMMGNIDGRPAHTVTKENGWHRVTFAPGHEFYLDRHSTMMSPPVVRLVTKTGKEVFAFDNLASDWAKVARPEVTFHEVKAKDGSVLNALLLAPQVRQGKAPVLTYVYGGPTAQTVRNAWSRLMPFFVHMTQRGYGVFLLDNRGTTGRDRKFVRAMKDNFGVVEVVDHLEGARWLKASVPWVDPDRLAVFGWSYGGSLSAHLILQKDTPFAAAVAVAPVTDWKLYDTHYTERYIGMPQTSADIYDQAAVVPLAENLERPFLLMHGMADDNVLFENSLALVERLQSKSVPFSFMAYPGRAHGLRGRGTQLHVFRTIRGFLDQEIGGAP